MDTKPYKRIPIEDLEILSDAHPVKNFYISLDKSPYWQKIHGGSNTFVFEGFLIAFYPQGNLSVKINGRLHKIGPGTLMILVPNQLVEDEERPEKAMGRYIATTLDMILAFPSPLDVDFINMARRQPTLGISESDMTRLLDYYSFIEKQYQNEGNPFRQEIIKALFYALLLEIYRLYQEHAGQRPPTLLRQEKLVDDFFLLLSRYFRQERSVAFYADKMNRTRRYLSSAIKKLTGRSMQEWINEVVISEIKIQLITTDLSVLQISEGLNFPNPSAFIQFFKLHTGTTPLKFRQSQALPGEAGSH